MSTRENRWRCTQKGALDAVWLGHAFLSSSSTSCHLLPTQSQGKYREEGTFLGTRRPARQLNVIVNTLFSCQYSRWRQRAGKGRPGREGRVPDCWREPVGLEEARPGSVGGQGRLQLFGEVTASKREGNSKWANNAETTWGKFFWRPG